MKIATVTLFAMVALLVLPPLHAKPQDIASLKQQFLFKVLQGMIEEQEEALAQQEEANAEGRFPGGYYEDMEEENVAQAMGAELEVARARKCMYNNNVSGPICM